MTPDQKNRLKTAAEKAAASAATAARSASGWRKWLYIAAAIAAAAAAIFLSTGCSASYTQTPGNIAAAVRIIPLSPAETK